MRVDQKRPLTPLDSEQKTYGCRHSNPSICKNNSTLGICAFVKGDNICTVPPRSWKKIYEYLLQQNN
jgi:hypothetical protein